MSLGDPSHMDWHHVQDCVGFTDRELEIVQLMHQGLSYKRIAHELECSPHTVETHRRAICDKVGARRRDQVLIEVTRIGLTD